MAYVYIESLVQETFAMTILEMRSYPLFEFWKICKGPILKDVYGSDFSTRLKLSAKWEENIFGQAFQHKKLTYKHCIKVGN